MMNEVIKKWYDEHGQEVKDLAYDLWENCEISMEEYHACQVTAAFMEKHGFTVETFNCKDRSLPANTVVATWGSGKPVMGFLGEYDGLPGMGQEVTTYKSPKPGAGQGCGHNLMAPSCGSAAIALKAAMEAEGLQGTIKFFACPAEESVEGKSYMARDGVFDGLDCCTAWHPQPRNLQIRELLQNSLCNLKIEFFGTSAHAAAYPERGRSALDACEIMNVGVNYMREHVESTTRIHYSYLAAGEKPNVVPDYAALHYFLRTKDLKSNYELLERIKKCAQGAALMTDTTVKSELLKGYSNLITIPTLQATANEAMHDIPLPMPTDAELEYAAQLQSTMKLTAAEKAMPPFALKVLDPAPPVAHGGSTDTADVSWNCPTVQMHIGNWVVGTPGHSWQSASQSRGDYAKRAMLYAGKAVAGTIMRLLDNPLLIEKAKEEFAAKTLGGYICPIPADVMPEIQPEVE